MASVLGSYLIYKRSSQPKILLPFTMARINELIYKLECELTFETAWVTSLFLWSSIWVPMLHRFTIIVSCCICTS